MEKRWYPRGGGGGTPKYLECAAGQGAFLELPALAQGVWGEGGGGTNRFKDSSNALLAGVMAENALLGLQLKI